MCKQIFTPFSRVYRLLKTDDFSSVFNFRCSVHGQFFQVLVKPNGLGFARLGLVVGKKIAKQAVKRNYIKRRVREVFRLNAADLTAVDFIVRAKISIPSYQRHIAMAELLFLLQKAEQKCLIYFAS